MKRYAPRIFCLCLLCLLILSACSINKVGTIPRGTPDTGNGTPAIVTTPTPDLSKVPQAPATATGSTYAFVRENQLWLAQSGGKAGQVTGFDFTKLSNVFWHRPLWSSDYRALAFIVSAQPTGVGGGGCGSPELGSSGSLYVMDAQTKQAMVLSVAGATSVALEGQPTTDQWQAIFWEDTTHLLAWYNGDAGKASATAGLYRYSFTTHELKLVIPLKSLGDVLLSSLPGANAPLLLSMHYSSGQLFYQVVVHPFEQKSQLVVYRHSVVHPEIASSQIISQGYEPWCSTTLIGAYSLPGWDISPDGEQLVAQMILSGVPGQGAAAVETVDLKDASTTNLFTQLDTDLLSHDLALTWSPDSQTVVASEVHPIIQRGPYSASLANPGTMQQYSPTLSGQLAWRSDGSAFALQQSNLTGDTQQPAVYLFLAGDAHGRLLLTDAQEFSWG